jgi:hypothetical protein
MTRESGLNNVGPVQLFISFLATTGELENSLGPEHSLLLSDRITLKGPQIPHLIEIQFLDELRYILPVHPLALRMEVEIFIA